MKVRAKRVTISAESLLLLFKNQTQWKVEKGIPSNAVLKGVILDPYSQVINLMVTHESFEPVDAYSVVPILETEIHKV